VTKGEHVCRMSEGDVTRIGTHEVVTIHTFRNESNFLDSARVDESLPNERVVDLVRYREVS